MDAGWASVFTGTFLNHACALFKKNTCLTISSLAKADTPRESIIDKYSGTAYLRMVRYGDTAQIISVSKNEQGTQTNDRMFSCMQEAATEQSSRDLFKFHPVFEPYRTSERFRQIVDGG